MIRLRRALGPLAAVWLACQAATLTFGSVVLWAAVETPGAECTCAGDHGICPMHHRPADGVKRCLLQSASDSDAAVLTALLGHVGLTPAPVQVFVPAPIVTSTPIDTTAGTLRPPPPDPPPPRA
jgi:hypothetical protein